MKHCFLCKKLENIVSKPKQYCKRAKKLLNIVTGEKEGTEAFIQIYNHSQLSLQSHF